jgi:hypothetical protein
MYHHSAQIELVFIFLKLTNEFKLYLFPNKYYIYLGFNASLHNFIKI